MSHFFDRYKQHPVHQALIDVAAAVESAKLELEDAAQIAGYERFRRVLEHAKDVLASVDPDLVTLDALSPINTDLANMKAHHDTFLSTRDWQQLNQPADQLLVHLNALPRPNVQTDGRVLPDTLESFRNRASEFLDAIKTKADGTTGQQQKIEQRLAEFGTKITAFDPLFETQKGRIDVLIGEQQTQFAQRLTTYDAQVSEQKARIDALISDQQTQFAQRSEERTTKHNELHTRFEQAEAARVQQFNERVTKMGSDFAAFSKGASESIEKLASEEKTRLGALLADHQSRSDESLKSLQGRLDEAVKIVGLIGNTGLTGNYQRVATDEKQIADRFRWIAIGSMVLMVLCVAWIVIHVTREDFNWQIALFRLVAAIAFGAPAWYCARESTHHRRIEHRNRRIELELASLSSYLAEMPVEDRRRIIAELSKDYFGRDDERAQGELLGKLKNVQGEDLIKWLERLIKAVK